MGHIVLLGDSIFDNARYVPGGPDVVEQVRRCLPAPWQATLLALDGDITPGVARQLAGLPPDATHLFVSVGGNDALAASGVLGRPASTVAGAFALVHQVQTEFRRSFQQMLRAVLSRNLPTTLCTIYDSIPGLPRESVAALMLFNDVILRSAFVAGLPVIDLRLTCDRPEDYSTVSPIEPSQAGGAKIARAVVEVALQHDFARRQTAVYF